MENMKEPVYIYIKKSSKKKEKPPFKGKKSNNKPLNHKNTWKKIHSPQW